MLTSIMGDLDNLKFLRGYMFTIGEYAMSWKALHSILTNKVEYMVLMEAVRETLWLRGLFSEFTLRG